MKLAKLFVLTLVVTFAALGFVAHSAGAADSIVVTNDDVARQQENTPPTRDWVIYTRTPASLGTFVVGPEAPPLGVGSFEMRTPTGSDKVFMFNFEHEGTPLVSIDDISYSTYRHGSSTAPADQVPAINLIIDFNGPAVAGGFSTLVFEPVYNTTQGAVVVDEWQDWDAVDGIWWSTRPINGMCASAAAACRRPWSYIVANNPDAVIYQPTSPLDATRGGFGVNQGSGNPGLIANTDALTIAYGGNSFVYDFEPYRVAATRDACKNGGWQSVKRADGSSFRNQGDCVSYASNGK